MHLEGVPSGGCFLWPKWCYGQKMHHSCEKYFAVLRKMHNFANCQFFVPMAQSVDRYNIIVFN